MKKKKNTERDFGVEVVGNEGDEVWLDGKLVGEKREVVRQLVVAGDDRAVTRSVELWTTSSTKDLQKTKLLIWSDHDFFA